MCLTDRRTDTQHLCTIVALPLELQAAVPAFMCICCAVCLHVFCGCRSVRRRWLWRQHCHSFCGVPRQLSEIYACCTNTNTQHLLLFLFLLLLLLISRQCCTWSASAWPYACQLGKCHTATTPHFGCATRIVCNNRQHESWAQWCGGDKFLTRFLLYKKIWFSKTTLNVKTRQWVTVIMLTFWSNFYATKCIRP